MAHRDFCIVDDGVVTNVIVIDDQDQATISLFRTRHDAVVEITEAHGAGWHPTAGRQSGPGIGSKFDGHRFFELPTPPVTLPEHP